MAKKQWRIKDSDELYNTSGWGAPYFSINQKGHVAVHPKGTPKKKLDLKELVDQITERGIQTPFLIRFNDILSHRLDSISNAFKNAIKEYKYDQNHSIIYPIKVNQQKHVVNQILKHSMKKGHGIEAGSKPELLAVMALSTKIDTPIVCNGYKDDEYFEIALMGTKLGKPVYPVIEKYSEFKTLIKAAKKLNVEPQFGVRIKLVTHGSGKWQSSSGHRSKFGLTITELLRGVKLLEKEGYLKGLKLLHFHQGSQITNISTLKGSIKEATRVYVELVKMGAPMGILDVGGGLGVDYSGAQANSENSMNYSLQEYANDVVFYTQEICDEAGVPHPKIFTESGRAVAAHHAVLVFDVLGVSGFDRAKIPARISKEAAKPLRDLFAIRKLFVNKKVKNIFEHYHDAIVLYQECQNLFGLGYLSLEERGLAEDLYFSILIRIKNVLPQDDELPDELIKLEQTLSDTYFANLSIFQSLPDLWAIDQRFPLMPIHRLKEKPIKNAVIADITCDSDGKIDQFIETSENQNLIPLHQHMDEQEYYLGAFLVGAYQETLGDLHNLFGDTNAVHVTLDSKNNPIIKSVVKGDTVKEVLGYVQYDIDELVDQMHDQIEQAVQDKKIDFKESGEFLKFYELALEGYTYLEDWETKEEY